MKITIYELLRLIKDNKAPYSIIYKKGYYRYSKPNRDYYGEYNSLFGDFYYILDMLDEEVEIVKLKESDD